MQEISFFVFIIVFGHNLNLRLSSNLFAFERVNRQLSLL